jgi:hypothetical protein
MNTTQQNNHSEDILTMAPTTGNIVISYGKSEYRHCTCSLCGTEKQCADSVVNVSVTGTTWKIDPLCDECFKVALDDLKRLLQKAARVRFEGGENT